MLEMNIALVRNGVLVGATTEKEFRRTILDLHKKIIDLAKG